MNPSDTGAAELLANLSIGTVVLIALVLTVARLILVSIKQSPQPGAPEETVPLARGIAEILESLVIAGVLVFLIIRPFFVQAFYIPSESMENTLLGHDEGTNPQTGITHPDTVHDHIFVNKLVFRYSEPQRGDIIVFKAPKEADAENKMRHRDQQENVLIKRLIGIPGDLIEVKNGHVYRNGTQLNEPYIKEPMDANLEPRFRFGTIGSEGDEKTPGGPVKLGPNQLWVMGDNRNDSNDSRYWGPLERSRVIGKANLIFFPLNRIRMLH